MKYSRLTKEQFESLHEEFTLFLAAQSIDKKKWEKIKTKHPEMTAALLDDFSDGIWDQSLDKITYLENRSDHHLFLFKCHEKQVDLILIKLEQDCPSMLLKDYKKWLSQNWSDPRVSIFQSHKIFEQGLKNEKFKLIREGAIVSEGATYEDFKSFLSK